MKNSKTLKLLGITIPKQSKKYILEKIIKYMDSKTSFCHIVSLNPENIIIAQNNLKFKTALNEAKIKIIDGVGVVIASKILKIEVGERYPGVDLAQTLLEEVGKRRLRALLIGGRNNLALSLSECYQDKYPEAKFFGLEGIKDIKNPTKLEEKAIFDIVADLKPCLILVAFGSPDQELWIASKKERLNNTICMGVGGGFDFLTNSVKRAPPFIQKIGLEWLYRLVNQPWRIKRQLRLIEFIWLVIRQKWNKN